MMKTQCPDCEGSGESEELCSSCNGSGMPKGWNSKGRCSICDGDGVRTHDCATCNGEGTVDCVCKDCGLDISEEEFKEDQRCKECKEML